MPKVLSKHRSLARRVFTSRSVALAIVLGAVLTVLSAWIGPVLEYFQVRGLDGWAHPARGITVKRRFEFNGVMQYGELADAALSSDCVLNDWTPTGPEGAPTRAEWVREGAPAWAALPQRLPADSTPSPEWSPRAFTRAHGWPARCAAWTRHYPDAPPGVRLIDVWTIRPSVGKLHLPARPYPPGLLINLIFWSAIAFIAVRSAAFALGRLAQGRRGRRGLCRMCGYSRTGLASEAVCPECGEVPRARAAGVRDEAAA